MRCPQCAEVDDKVIDSRASEDAGAIRRRRECLACGHRFTTFERVEEQPLVVVKRSGDRHPFDRARIVQGVALAAKGRQVDEGSIDALAVAVEDEMRLDGGEVTTEQVGRAVLERLRDLDAVAALRFASVYKGFDDVADFEDEIAELAKRTEPKNR